MLRFSVYKAPACKSSSTHQDDAAPEERLVANFEVQLRQEVDGAQAAQSLVGNVHHHIIHHKLDQFHLYNRQPKKRLGAWQSCACHAALRSGRTCEVDTSKIIAHVCVDDLRVRDQKGAGGGLSLLALQRRMQARGPRFSHRRPVLLEQGEVDIAVRQIRLECHRTEDMGIHLRGTRGQFGIPPASIMPASLHSMQSSAASSGATHRSILSEAPSHERLHKGDDAVALRLRGVCGTDPCQQLVYVRLKQGADRQRICLINGLVSLVTACGVSWLQCITGVQGHFQDRIANNHASPTKQRRARRQDMSRLEESSAEGCNPTIVLSGLGEGSLARGKPCR